MLPSQVDVQLDGPIDSPWNTAAGLPSLVLWSDPTGAVVLSDRTTELRRWSEPLSALQWLSGVARQAPASRWVGFISYDLASWLEPALRLRHTADLPLFAFARIEPIAASANRRDSEPSAPRTSVIAESNFTPSSYRSAVARAIEYVHAGDVFQVNLSQRFDAPAPTDPMPIYETMQRHRPAHYGAYLRFGDLSLLCNSPELFLHVTPDRRVLTRPIKGTRPIGLQMDAELLNSAKDQAELNMIIDLERNDLGRVCEIGSVKVIEPRTVQQHPTVYHGVAGISGTLRPEVDLLSLLKATFPGGSVTGAPKVRAMHIIDELETCARGPYCGAIGYLGGDGSIMFNIAIRTMVCHRGRIIVPVGGGIVADSNPNDEYKETLVKAVAMFEALGITMPR